MSKRIDVVDEDGTILLSVETHWIPEGMTADDVIKEVLPSLSLLYGYKCFYTDEEFELYRVH